VASFGVTGRNRPNPVGRRRRLKFYEGDIPDRPNRSWSADAVRALGRGGTKVFAALLGRSRRAGVPAGPVDERAC